MASTISTAGVGATSLPNDGDVVANAGRRFAEGGGDGDRIGMLVEGLGELLRLDRLAVGHGHADRLGAERLAQLRQRSPQRPALRQITLPPGGTQLTTAASMPPVPEQVSVSTGLFVQKTYFRSSCTSMQQAPGLGAAVVEDRLGHFQEGVFGDRRRSRRQHAVLHWSSFAGIWWRGGL